MSPLLRQINEKTSPMHLTMPAVLAVPGRPAALMRLNTPAIRKVPARLAQSLRTRTFDADLLQSSIYLRLASVTHPGVAVPSDADSGWGAGTKNHEKIARESIFIEE